ncbi:MAG: oligosaccharide flippase family protein, partial [Nakamurella sp.]
MTDVDSAAAGGLAGSASRGALVTLGGQAVRVIVQLAGIVILARLLGPSDYGLVAMVTVIVGVGEVFRDFGLSSAAIQAKVLTRQQKDNLFWINVGIGLVLTLLVCALAAPIAHFYDDARLQPLTYALSLTFLLNGLSTQFRADLARHLRFFRLTLADQVGLAVALVAAVLLAANGAGYWALVVQQVGQALVILVMLVCTTGWLPRGMHRGAGMRPFISYGSNVFGA